MDNKEYVKRGNKIFHNNSKIGMVTKDIEKYIQAKGKEWGPEQSLKILDDIEQYR